MSERERPSYLPALPERYPRTDYVPAHPPAPAGEGVPSDPAELVAAVAVPPPVDAGGGPAPTPGEMAPTAEVRERERVTLTGRLGQNLRIRTTPKGTLVAQFPLGVKDEADLTKTTWHQVLAFRERAAQVRDTFTKGDAVEVIGYRHAREIPGRTGPRTVTEVYATVGKPGS